MKEWWKIPGNKEKQSKRMEELYEKYPESNPMKRAEVRAKFMGDNNPSKRLVVREKIRRRIIEFWKIPGNKEKISGENSPTKSVVARAKKREYHRQHPEFAAHISSCNKSPSKPQVEMYNGIKQFFPTAILNYLYKPIKGRHIVLDVAVPELKWDFEYDGSYWHQDKEKDRLRDEGLKEDGWKIFRFNPNGKIQVILREMKL